ncbi:hypothetical protein L6164_020639 [Bauhinia variegata]|uniref:Uncharacterized protein n=1 Tax=Bauhinia variegata TaxID=167791 RepID=A0ACB9MVR9_BAUVA|nr:hypothetical protein L6164_020639 [Bauhinia variegata]
MVYPGAVHPRFEHSLGVYWLAGRSIDIIKKYQGPELGIEYLDVQTVKLAGLLHDVGHSHMFEHGFLPRVLTGSKWSHEDMSMKMIDYIVDQHNIDIDLDTLKKVKSLRWSVAVEGCAGEDGDDGGTVEEESNDENEEHVFSLNLQILKTRRILQ